MNAFTENSLPGAISSLFRLNHYDVTGPQKIHGAEIDLIAKPQADPFGVNIYIEATIEYVDNTKYGKDVTKFLLIREKDPSARLVIISSSGFSLPVRERATESRVETYTYAELFRKFQRFSAYIDLLSNETELGMELSNLDRIYEEPYFNDASGKDKATEYLSDWRTSRKDDNRWLIITGEYGTGKTALTKILQHRWLNEHIKDPDLPLPFRIELRDFVRQFDARGLLHHFLDRNSLSHLSIEFVESLIRTGKIILILDGYDEMAQYLHARERRACLEALAELSSGGAKGILTSRPNYFTEAEELQVFEILYASLKAGRYYLGKKDEQLLEQEQRVDQLLEKFIDRHERQLEDLSPAQTEALVRNALANDPQGRDAVMKILTSVFRSVGSGDEISLSGKPVIISYLLEVVEGIRDQANTGDDRLTEWQVYKLIVDQLMLRDLRRSPEITPIDRRRFLQDLSLRLSHEAGGSITERGLKDLISKTFHIELRRWSGQQRIEHLDKLFADLRSSTTLTRSSAGGEAGWRFSHNSLREFLSAERTIEQLLNKEIPKEKIWISDAMQQFVASKSTQEINLLNASLTELWPQRIGSPSLGSYVDLIWPAIFKMSAGSGSVGLRRFAGSPVAVNEVEISRLTLSTEGCPADLNNSNFSRSSLSIIDLSWANLMRSDFSGALLEGVKFNHSNLSECDFSNSMIIDSSFVDVQLEKANFKNIVPDYISIVVYARGQIVFLTGLEAIGYLAFHGAVTDSISASLVMRHHPKYFIAQKILSKLGEQSIRQRRGLAQRGAARHDTAFANGFVDHLETVGIIKTPLARKDLVEPTDLGRVKLKEFTEGGALPDEVIEYLSQYPQ
jgi:uncharacterized protein YjbI with pentapeptide repeats